MPATAAARRTAPASTREAILDAAERRFADHGFDGASIRDIAADVGLKNQASIYHYYQHKRALYEAVLRRGVEALIPLWTGAAGTESDGDRVHALAASLDGVIDHLIAHPHLARLIERAGLDEDRFVQTTVRRVMRPLYETGMRVLEDAATAWQPSELPHLAAGIYHLIFGYFANAGLLQTVLEEDPRSPQMLATQRRFIVQAVVCLLGQADSTPFPRIIKQSSERT